MKLGRPDIALRLLEYPRARPRDLLASTYQMISRYTQDPASSSLQVIRALLARVADDVHENNYGVLNEAVRSGHAELVSSVLTVMRQHNGRRVGVDSSKGFALYTAAFEGHKDIVSLLLSAGAAPSIEDNHPFRNALRNEHLEVMRVLSSAAGFVPVKITPAQLARRSRAAKQLITELRLEGKVSSKCAICSSSSSEPH